MVFDEERLAGQLKALPTGHRTAFAASCCERMLPNYLAFSRVEGWGRPETLREALDEVWAILGGRPAEEERIRSLVETCVELAPDTEEFQSLFVSAAGDAAAAVAYTLESCLDGDAGRAATVGRLSTETLYQYLTRVNDPLTGVHVSDADFEEQMLKAPLMLAELDKQDRDLQLLQTQDTLTPALLKQLRDSSTSAGIRPFERGLVKS
jgi:uncharacterized protein YjaG (DUF416 family)